MHTTIHIFVVDTQVLEKVLIQRLEKPAPVVFVDYSKILNQITLLKFVEEYAIDFVGAENLHILA